MSCPDEDLLLLSKAYYERYGEMSCVMALERSADLASCQDYEGVAVWHRVAERIDRLAAAGIGAPEAGRAAGNAG